MNQLINNDVRLNSDTEKKQTNKTRQKNEIKCILLSVAAMFKLRENI